MTGTWLHRSAYHHRLVGYGDFLRRVTRSGAGSQSVTGGPSEVVASPRATAAAAGQTGEKMGAVRATHGGNPSLGLGLADVAELAMESITAHSKGSDSAAGGDTQRTITNKQPRHSCKCGICDACTAPSSRQPAPICHHVACKSLEDCKILPGSKPYRFVNPDNRRTARISWLPTNFWSKTGQLSQSEQVSRIASSFELDSDEELISHLTATIRGGMKALFLQKNRRFHQKSVRKTLENMEGLLKAGMLDERSPFYNLFASRLNQQSGPAQATSSRDAHDKKDGEDAAKLRFQLLLGCMTQADQMIASGQITEAEKDQALMELMTKVMNAFDESQRLKKQGTPPRSRTQPWMDKWTGYQTARVQTSKEMAELEVARKVSGMPRAAHGREPRIRSRLASEVWIADPEKPKYPIEALESMTLADANLDAGYPDTDIYGVSDDSEGSDSDDDDSDSDESRDDAKIETSKNSDLDGDDDSDEEEVILFKGRRRA